MAGPAPAARGIYKPRRPQASPLSRLVSGHLHRLQTVYDERFAREYGPWRSVVAQVADKLLACGVASSSRPVRLPKLWVIKRFPVLKLVAAFEKVVEEKVALLPSNG